MRKFWLTLAMAVLLTCLFAVSVSAANVVDSGKCGDNVTWTLYDDGELVIEGTGGMFDWFIGSHPAPPWYSHSSSIKKATIKNGVTNIGACAFYYCSNLTSVSIPNTVSSIKHGFLRGCENITSVTIPKNVTDIASDAFYYCKSLLSIRVDPDNPNYSSDAIGVLFNKDKTALIAYPPGKSGSYSIPSTVLTIYAESFKECDKLTSVTIPNSVTSIGNDAFGYCDGLTSVTIPNSVTKIGGSPFCGCKSLTSIRVDSGNPKYSASSDGVLFDKEKTLLIQYPAGKTGSYAIPNSVTSLGYQAFESCGGLTSLTIPNSVKYIGYSCFFDCDSLVTLTLSGVIEIGQIAFVSCDNLTSVIIPNSTTAIHWRAFANCTKLTSVTILSKNIEFDTLIFDYSPSTFTIHAYPGSTAETYAKQNDHKFVVLTTPPPHTHTPGAAATCTTAQTCTSCGTVLAKATGHKPGAAATCTTAQTCTSCGTVLAKATGHKPGAAATCTTAQTCTSCGEILAEATGHTEVWAGNEDHPHDFTVSCSVCGITLYTGHMQSPSDCKECFPDTHFPDADAPATDAPITDAPITDAPDTEASETEPPVFDTPDAVADTAASVRGAQIRHTLWISFVVVFCVVIAVYELIHLRNKNTKDESES